MATIIAKFEKMVSVKDFLSSEQMINRVLEKIWQQEVNFSFKNKVYKTMTRISKQAQRRHQKPKRRHYNLAKATGPKKDNLPKGYKEHVNAAEAENCFIAKIK